MDHERLCRLLDINPTEYLADDYELGQRILQLKEDSKQLQKVRDAIRLLMTTVISSSNFKL